MSGDMNKNNHADAVQGLLDSIKKHNELYRKGEPDISDAEYDALIDKLKDIDSNNEWFNNIEPAPVENVDRKRKLPIPMKSLYKVKSIAELKKWAKNLGLTASTSLVCMPKYDGISLLIDNQQNLAYSRGGAQNMGMDCSKHLKLIPLNYDTVFKYVYGELVFSTKNWSKIAGTLNEDGVPYKSPRNTISGLINRDVPSPLLEHTTFVAYGASDEDLKEHNTFTSVLHQLDDMPNYYMELQLGQCTEDMLMDLYRKWRSKFYIDGLVIYINDLNMWRRIKRHETTGNPLYAIAYKTPDFTDTFETTVLGVEWGMTKSGALKPVVQIEPVDTGDCIMQNPTGYNARWIANNSIAKGAKVLVTRSGGVIPKILDTLSPASTESIEQQNTNLKVCPYCGSPTEMSATGVELLCTNPNCQERKFQENMFFFQICGIKDLGEEAFRKLAEAGFTELSDILHITTNRLYKIDGFGDSTVNTFLENMKRIDQGIPLAKAMHASNCFEGIGQIKAQSILDTMSDDEINTMILGNIPARINPRSSVTMKSFVMGIPKFHEWYKKNGITLDVTKAEVNANGKFANMKICFTGFRDEELQKQIQAEGGQVVSSVSSKTSIVVVLDSSVVSSKTQKANDLGIKIMSLDAFKASMY